MTTIFSGPRCARLPHAAPLLSACRPFRRPSPGMQLPDSNLLARQIRVQVLGLVWLFFTANQLGAATTVTITNDWAATEVRLVVPKPFQGPLSQAWSDTTQGAAESQALLQKSGMDPTHGWFSGSAGARIGPLVGVSNGFNHNGLQPGFTQVFGSRLIADDNGSCEAQATLDSVWHFSVTGDPAPFNASGFVEFGHSMDFTLDDCTTGLRLFSKSLSGMDGFNVLSTLEPSHEYMLTLNQRALFGGGDGQVGFGFGFSTPVQVEFASDRTHLPVPDGGTTATMFGVALASLAVFRRKFHAWSSRSIGGGAWISFR